MPRKNLSRKFAVTAVAVAAVALPSLTTGWIAGAVGNSPARSAGVGDDVHLNEIQTIGSHNSYHLIPSAPEVDIRRGVIGDANDLMTYQHAPLPEQFASQKVRQIELDVFVDSAGGLYANPLLRSVAGVGAYDPRMNEPGLKVLHIQDVDYASTCLTLNECLTQVKGWSDANPSHVPLSILLELKDTPLILGDFDFVTPEKWTSAAMNDLDAEIRSVFPPSQMITPDDVRGTHATLDEAVTTDGWPSLGASRGKVMFLMDNGGGYRSDYRSGHPTLEGRVLFTNSNPGQPDAGFVKRNDPFDASIPGLVSAGYVVRTRADGDTVEARANDTSKRDAALASGAQWVSTDFPIPGIAVGFTTSYVAAIPGGTVARCNPVNGPASCVSSTLESIPAVPPSPTTSTTTTEPGPSTVPGSTSTTTPGPSTTTRPHVGTTTPRSSYPVARPATTRRGPVAYTG